MNTLDTLFEDLMILCENNEAFYFVDQYKDSAQYRVFTYRLASFTDFQNRNAIECRGHTFRNDNGIWELASLPPSKFFNYGEHLGWNTPINYNKVSAIMDKVDGSLISTVTDGNGSWFLKSKTSFTSQQAQDATLWLDDEAQYDLYIAINQAVEYDEWTVNFEWVSPDNQIVIGYDKARLIILNARNMDTGAYMSRAEMITRFGIDNIVQSFPIPDNMEQWFIDAEKLTGIEGFVVTFEDGLWVKHKTEAYCILHHLKDSINNARRLWEACINETADDLRALFHDDPISIAKIIDMEEKAAKIYSHVHKTVHGFYNANKELDRKSYAIKGQAELNAEGLFGLAMNLYLGKECDIKAFLIKNYKNYDINDVEEKDGE